MAEETPVASKKKSVRAIVERPVLLRAYELMFMAKRMAETYDENKEVCSKYVHSTSRGHEAIQLATGLQLKK